MSHIISLGADIYGNITRMDNVVDGLAKELAEKSARLKELNILLNMDQKDRSVLDDGPAEESLEKEKQREQDR